MTPILVQIIIGILSESLGSYMFSYMFSYIQTQLLCNISLLASFFVCLNISPKREICILLLCHSYSWLPEQIYKSLGSFVGGYVFLINNIPPNYISGMMRFHLSSILFDCLIVSDIPFFFLPLRFIAKKIISLSAYYAPLIPKLIGKLSDRPLILLGVLLDRYVNESKENIVNKILDLISSLMGLFMPYFSSLHISILSKGLFNKYLRKKLRNKLRYLDRSPSNFILKSAKLFGEFIAKSENIIKKQKDFEENYPDVNYRQALIQALNSSIKRESKTAKVIHRYILNNIQPTPLFRELVSKIREIETLWIGIPLLRESQAEYWEDMFSIYFQYYLTYSLIHFNEINEIIVSEEIELQEYLREAFFSLYLKSILPRRIIRPVKIILSSIVNEALILKKIANHYVDPASSPLRVGISDHSFIDSYFSI